MAEPISSFPCHPFGLKVGEWSLFNGESDCLEMEDWNFTQVESCESAHDHWKTALEDHDWSISSGEEFWKDKKRWVTKFRQYVGRSLLRIKNGKELELKAGQIMVIVFPFEAVEYSAALGGLSSELVEVAEEIKKIPLEADSKDDTQDETGSDFSSIGLPISLFHTGGAPWVQNPCIPGQGRGEYFDLEDPKLAPFTSLFNFTRVLSTGERETHNGAIFVFRYNHEGLLEESFR